LLLFENADRCWDAADYTPKRGVVNMRGQQLLYLSDFTVIFRAEETLRYANICGER
jgi:hypothetical protein